MKLVDILALHLSEWPAEDPFDLGQARDGDIHIPGHSGKYIRHLGVRLPLADNWDSENVTRSQWQAAVDALEAEKVVEWNGEGLPPVGIDVEVFAKYSHLRFDRFIGKQVHIVAHDVINGDPVAVFRMPIDGDDTEQDYHAMVAGSFRQIRTPEQIAAEDRMNSAKIFYSLVFPEGKWHKLDDSARESWAAIYDAGYRKLEIVDN